MKRTDLHVTLGKVFRSHWRASTARFAKLGLSSAQPKILHFLSDNAGAMQKEIAESCNIEPATATSVLTGMEQAQLIVRRADEKDRRVVRTYLTEKGQDMLHEISNIFKEIEDDTYLDFTDAEIDQLHQLLERMAINLSKSAYETSI